MGGRFEKEGQDTLSVRDGDDLCKTLGSLELNALDKLLNPVRDARALSEHRLRVSIKRIGANDGEACPLRVEIPEFTALSSTSIVSPVLPTGPMIIHNCFIRAEGPGPNSAYIVRFEMVKADDPSGDAIAEHDPKEVQFHFDDGMRMRLAASCPLIVLRRHAGA